MKEKGVDASSLPLPNPRAAVQQCRANKKGSPTRILSIRRILLITQRRVKKAKAHQRRQNRRAQLIPVGLRYGSAASRNGSNADRARLKTDLARMRLEGIPDDQLPPQSYCRADEAIVASRNHVYSGCTVDSLVGGKLHSSKLCLNNPGRDSGALMLAPGLLLEVQLN